MPELERYPVAIIGGGPVGLVSSILLSQQKIPHVLFERYPSTSIHPKACGMNMRTVEIFRQIGIEREVLEQRAPQNTVSRTTWRTTLGPTSREIIGRDAWGGGAYQEEYKGSSPCPYVIIPQIRLEPILQRRAIELNPQGIRYGVEVTDTEEDGDRVILTTRDTNGSGICRFEARYVIGADGGRGLTDELGIKWERERDILDMVSAHFKAPLSAHHPDPRNFITWFIDPLKGGSIRTGYLYHLGPYPVTTETEEWLFACAVNPENVQDFKTEDMVERIHGTLQIPDLDINLISLSHWRVDSIVAEKYRSEKGRIFLVGDAAHRIPPWGALGLNTGIQDAHNLVWKLGLAIRSDKLGRYSALLDTYETERRPIGLRVAQTSLHNLQSHALIMDRALGISPQNNTESNVKAMEEYFIPHSTEGKSRRQAVQNAQNILDTEFHALGAEIGWFYPNIDPETPITSSNHGGQLLPNGELNCLQYHPSLLPGHHLPHIWLEKNGVVRSTRDLIPCDTLLFLISGPYGEATYDGVARVERIGDSGWRDADGMWANLKGHLAGILVRPDGIIAWKADHHSMLDMTGKGLAVVIERLTSGRR
ncbi:hypothetical protein N7499_009775 [Penicillium canescens]|nr:hypothetical protein N7499_009775 [Penicillium canescens]KAJ6170437.1 hypothetical protein N7485_007783 [Penicillium canescens]